MKISVSDDRPPIVPIVAAGFFAGVVGVLAAALLGVAGMGPSNFRSLLGIGGGLLAGLLVKDRLVGAYQGRWRGGTTDGVEPKGRTEAAEGEPTGAGTDETDEVSSIDEAGSERPDSPP